MGYGQRNGSKFTPAYKVGGKKYTCSAKVCGTFDTQEAAKKHADECEAKARAGTTTVTATPTVRALAPFDSTGPLTKEQKATLDVNATWKRYCRRNKRPELITLENYTAQMERKDVGVLDYFGTQRPDDIEADAVSYWIEAMEEAGVTPGNIRASLMAFSSLMKFAMAPREGIRTRAGNPCHGHGVTKPLREKKDIHFVVKPEHFQLLMSKLATRGMQVLTAALMGTGARSEEAFALRVEHVMVAQSQIALHDRVTWPKANLERGHLGGVLVHTTTKAKNVREVPIQPWLLALLVSWIEDNDLQRGDLLFPAALVLPGQGGHGFVDDSGLPELTDEFIATLGYTKRLPVRFLHVDGTVNLYKGLRSKHGTLAGATTGKCRDGDDGKTPCIHCAHARRNYDRARRAKQGTAGSTRLARKRTLGLADHLRYESFNTNFSKAVTKAGLPELMGWRLTPHALRHSWISSLANAPGANIAVVSRLAGHKSIETTMLYVHGAPEAERAAIAVLPQGYAVAV